jgi:hypothetical protein
MNHLHSPYDPKWTHLARASELSSIVYYSCVNRIGLFMRWPNSPPQGSIILLLCSFDNCLIISPQPYFMEHNGGGILCTPQGIILTLNDHSTLCVPWHQQSNLSYLLTQNCMSKSMDGIQPCWKAQKSVKVVC